MKRSIHAEYTLDKKLGSGGFSEVRLCRNKVTGKDYAVKIIKFKSKNEFKKIKDEIEIMQSLPDHPNIAGLIDMFTDSDGVIYLILDLCDGDLLQLVLEKGGIPEAEAKEYFARIVHALHICHTHNIVHRDVKLENILIANGQSDSSPNSMDGMSSGKRLLISDFGLSTFYKNAYITKRCGSPLYMAPEMFGERGYDFKVDIWSLGVILYSMLSCQTPFKSSKADQYKTVEELEPHTVYDFHYDIWSTISSEAKELVTRLMTVDPEKRITMEELFQHPWLSSTFKRFGLGFHGNCTNAVVSSGMKCQCGMRFKYRHSNSSLVKSLTQAAQKAMTHALMLGDEKPEADASMGKSPAGGRKKSNDSLEKLENIIQTRKKNMFKVGGGPNMGVESMVNPLHHMQLELDGPENLQYPDGRKK
eukprot:Nk52_evm14s156 gene=Nk52_evmTU14s156